LNVKSKEIISYKKSFTTALSNQKINSFYGTTILKIAEIDYGYPFKFQKNEEIEY
jgi:hypothetical protein